MVSFQIEELGKFMSMLLSGDAFDAWEIVEAKAETFCEVHLSGRIKKDFFDTEERENLPEYAAWREVKPLFYQAIKGKKLPLAFTVVLMPPKDDKEEQTTDKRFLNIRYTKQGCVITTGFSQVLFSLDKTAEQTWDTLAGEWLKKKGILYTRE